MVIFLKKISQYKKQVSINKKKTFKTLRDYKKIIIK